MALPTAAPPVDRRIAWCLLAADGTLLESEDAARPVYAASTIKLHVLAAVLRAADAGGLDLTRTVPATRTFTGITGAAFTLGGDHLDPTHPANGHPVGLDELAIRMIDRSSNEATDHLLEIVGLEAVAQEIDRLGLTATRVDRLIGDAAAIEQGLTNESSPADLVSTLRSLMQGEGLSLRSRDLARHALRAQRIPIIATALRSGVPWGSKSGWVDGYRHDVAAIGNPEDGDERYLAVMTSGMELTAADEQIRALTRRLLPRWAAAAGVRPGL